VDSVGPTPAPSTQPPPAPAQLVVGTAQSIDSGASGNPVSVHVARSANGDGFAVWMASDGTRHDLWANRYRAAAATWGSPISIEASSADIDDFDLAVDASGNAIVVWHEVSSDPLIQGVVMSARFDAGAVAWATAVPLNTNGRQPRVASDATGAVLAVYVDRPNTTVIKGRFFDPVDGTWQPEAKIEQNTADTGFSFSPLALLDGSGNALVAFQNGRTGVGLVASNYFSRSTGGWGQLSPDTTGILGGVPGTFGGGIIDHLQLATSTDANFLLAWSSAQSEGNPKGAEILIAHFTSRTRTWSAEQTLVPGSTQKNVQLQRMGSDADGNALLLWTENEGMRTALKALRLDDAGAACSAVQLADSAVGGGAARADLGVDPLGHAIAIWQQFEGGRADDGSRSNIAINRFDGATGTWADAVLAEAEPGNAFSPHASANGGQVLLGWIQDEGGANRVKALLQPLTNTPGQ